MKVFSACMKIIRKNLLLILLYNLMFAAIGIVAGQMSSGESDHQGFENSDFHYTLIDRDDNPALADSIQSYLNHFGQEVSIADETEALQDALFFDSTNAILIIPGGFASSLENGNPENISFSAKPDSASGYYVQFLLQSYLDTLSLCMGTPGISDLQQAAETALQISLTEAPVHLLSDGRATSISTFFQQFTVIEYYILVVVIMLCVSAIFIPFNRLEIRMRNNISPLSPMASGLQKWLAALLISLGIWIFTSFCAFLIDWKSTLAMEPVSLLLIWCNSLLASLTAMAGALVCSHFIRNPNIQNAAANIAALILSFLGGVFVPLDLLGENVIHVGRFLPSYWYSTTADEIFHLSGYSAAQLRPVFTGLLIQLGFFLALLCISLVLSRYQIRGERTLGNTRTELVR